MRLHYYDFASERHLKDWREIGRDGRKHLLECIFECEEGDYILLWKKNLYSSDFDIIVMTVNGETADQPENDFYISESGVRLSRKIHAAAGMNVVRCEILLPSRYGVNDFSMQLLPVFPEVEPSEAVRLVRTPPDHDPLPETVPPSTEGQTAGIGHELAPGRFGMLKGDGLLDCAMSRFGKIDKMFLCGHPAWNKPYPWSFSLMQSEKEWSAEDQVQVNPLHVEWQRAETKFLYSIASPGIVVENPSGCLRISKLEFAGSFRYVMTASESASLEAFSGDMPENWLLFFGSREFPEVPLLVLPDRKPSRIEFRKLPGGQLSEILFHGCRRLTVATPFGFDIMDPKSPQDEAFFLEAVRRCRFWSRALLAVPVACREYYQLKRAEQKVRIVQKFEYRFYSDEWGTVPLKLAPLPPVLALCGQKMPEDALDFRFPTKYGPLHGYISDGCEYTIAMMNTHRKFPLCDGKSGISELLQDGLKEFMDFEALFPDTCQSYAYPGAILESYAYCCSMVNFMPEDVRKKFQEELAKRLPLACDPDRKYTLLAIDREALAGRLGRIPADLSPDERDRAERQTVYEYFSAPDMPKMKMFNLYERTERFTGCNYYLCYLNCGMFSNHHLTKGTREEIRDYPHPCIENEWGMGLSLYMIYLSVLTTGDVSAVRKHWQALKKMFKFFEIFHDWACMASGYAEKARTWIEGAGYGAFPAIINLAEMVGDTVVAERYTYLGAKMLALSEARFLAGPYFAGQYHVEPWYGNRFFQEEFHPGNYFLHVPHELCSGRVQKIGISMLSTDAIYPELFESFLKTIPQAHRDLISRFHKALLDGSDDHWVEFSYMLVNNALDESICPEQTVSDMELAIRTKRFVRLWHDIDRFENNLPKNYLKSQILAWLEMRKHPLWLEHWQGIRVDHALWNAGSETAEIRLTETEGNGMLFCGIRKQPEGFAFTGGSAAMKHADGKLIFELKGSGVLSVYFKKETKSNGSV